MCPTHLMTVIFVFGVTLLLWHGIAILLISRVALLDRLLFALRSVFGGTVGVRFVYATFDLLKVYLRVH